MLNCLQKPYIIRNETKARGRCFVLVHIVLVEPEIPANTGNIGRTCVATGSQLHLIRPLGFDISDKQVRRSGLDYWKDLDLHVYDNLDVFFQKHPTPNLWLATTKAPRHHSDPTLGDDCFLFFGKESAGLPLEFRERYPDRCIRIPMVEEQRSLNLSNAVAVLTYEALRQQNYQNLQRYGEMAQQTEGIYTEG